MFYLHMRRHLVTRQQMRECEMTKQSELILKLTNKQTNKQIRGGCKQTNKLGVALQCNKPTNKQTNENCDEHLQKEDLH